jgi:hypothetical protein
VIPFVLADHSLISAVPFLVPALIIIGFLAFHVIRDRRSEDGDEPEVYEDDWGGPGADRSQSGAEAPSNLQRDADPPAETTPERTAGER